MVATTGRFTNPAEEYADRLQRSDDPYPIELIDGEGLREIADEIGLDLYNGRIEILCDETLRPYDPAADVDAPVQEAFRDIENIQAADLPVPHSQVTFRPVVAITADTNAVFETSVGVIHRINDRTQFVVHAERGHPKVADDDVATLVTENFHATVDLDVEQFGEVFDDVDERRFGQTQTEYKEWAVDRLQEYHTTTVTYTGDNNVTYNKTCEPNRSDVSVRSIEPVYLPAVRQTTEMLEYSYPYEYYAAGPSRVTLEDGIHRCVHCETSSTDEPYTYCPNCGFALKTKYFYDEENLDAFREEYAAMPLHEKAMENRPLVLGGVLATLLFVVGVLVIVGIV
jgi:restriction endonuclease Mrr